MLKAFGPIMSLTLTLCLLGTLTACNNHEDSGPASGFGDSYIHTAGDDTGSTLSAGCGRDDSGFNSYGLDELQAIQSQVDQGNLVYRSSDPVATTLEYMNDPSRHLLSGSVTDSSLTWVDPNRAALVSVETDVCHHRVMLQKLLREDVGGAWFVVGVDSHSRELGPDFVSFRTRDPDEAQSQIAFKLTLPTYLPGDIQSPPWLSGPTANEYGTSAYDSRVHITYISAELGIDFTAAVFLNESNHPISLPDPVSKQEYRRIVIDGVDVAKCTFPTRDPETKADLDISYCQFMWNQGSIGFVADINGFTRSEAMKIIASMIQSGPS